METKGQEPRRELGAGQGTEGNGRLRSDQWEGAGAGDPGMGVERG